MRHVIGFGNPLHGDDGVAAHICSVLSTARLAPDVRIFDAGTRGLDALVLLAGCEEALLIDAARPAGRPGRIGRPLCREVVAESGLSGHVGGLGFLLEALMVLDPSPPKLRLLTIEAGHPGPFQPGLSPAVADAARQVIAELMQELGAP